MAPKPEDDKRGTMKIINESTVRKNEKASQRDQGSGSGAQRPAVEKNKGQKR